LKSVTALTYSAFLFIATSIVTHDVTPILTVDPYEAVRIDVNYQYRDIIHPHIGPFPPSMCFLGQM
jgi:hypothetical protein